MKIQSRPTIFLTFFQSFLFIGIASLLSVLVLSNSATAASIDNSNMVIAQATQDSKSSGKETSSQNEVMSRVNVNNADAQTLSDALKGIGLKKAQAIVEWRKQNGKFVALEQLLEVKGIGEKTLQANRPYMTL